MQYMQCCRDCVAPKRHSGCHGTCKTYKEEKASWEAHKKEIRKQKDKEDAVHYVLRKKF